EDRGMRAWYAQVGVRLHTGIAAIPEIMPYCRYQSWNQDTNGEDVTEYLTVGAAVPLGGTSARFRIDYETPMRTPDGQDEEASRLTVRVQVSI
ncbi:hypothetical protein K8S17_01250, partial [bacterium]|nr:hypothetical protein [bacterium]